MINGPIARAAAVVGANGLRRVTPDKYRALHGSAVTSMGMEIATNMAVDLTLNGKPASIASPQDTPLLWALRDEKQLVGVKFGCGVGLCGACTVMVDGAQQRSCQTMVGDIAGKSVTTIEGLSGTVARAVIEGWVKAQAPQCGYCQPGFVMAATSVIAADPKQPREAVLAQLTNICRCGTYDAIRAAVGYALETLDRASAPQKQGSAL